MERRLAAILAADVVGYARLMGVDEAATLAALKVHRAEVIEPKAMQYRGRTIKLMGDGVLMEFPSVVDAVAFAVEVQGALGAREAGLPEVRRIAYRIGINIGDIIVEGEDIYGDGVNVAARLEAIAEPGGVCIARNVFNHIKDKLDLTFESLGERKVKNIAEPVSVYRIVFDEKATALATPVKRSAAEIGRRARPLVAAALAVTVLVTGAALWWQPWAPEFEPVEPAVMARPLPAKPSIAVLAFDDLSQGDDRGYMSDAIAEGIITKLSHFSELFVVARNSSFFFKDKAADVRAIAIDLGVRYLLEGSQQKAGERLRVTVQLIDALAGNHIWAETYDRNLVDVFAVQDEIAATVASTIGAKVLVVAGEATKKGDPARLRAFELWLKGTRHWYEWTKEGNELAREFYLKAVEADPTLPRGHLGLAWVHINGYRWGWTELDRDAALAQARLRAQKGMDLAPDDYFPHQTMANVLMQAGERDQALVEFEKALALNPNAANLMMDFGEALVYAGRTREAIDQMQNAMRRDPHHPDWFYWTLGWALYAVGDYEDALATMNRMSKVPGLAQRTLAAIYVRLGRHDEARAAVEALLAHDPGHSLEKMRLYFVGKFQNHAVPARFVEDLRKAGLPEQ
jgi:adenylate cyclase